MKVQGDNVVSEELLSRASEVIATEMGLYFPRDRWSDLQRGLVAAASSFGFDEVEACIRWLISAPLRQRQVEVLAGHLTVGETYFFREKRLFEVLEQEILPRLIRARRLGKRRLRFWSAGCCSGEEPYSLAILLDRMIPDRELWDIRILGTDINPTFLEKAARGLYSEWSFRNTLPVLKERYFRRTEAGRYELRPEIREMVTFSHLNLVAPNPLPGSRLGQGMDIIFCRNVLMYFSRAGVQEVVRRLNGALAADGWLVVSPSEGSLVQRRFRPVNFPGAIFYQKAAGDLPGMQPPPLPAPEFLPPPESRPLPVAWPPPVEEVAEERSIIPPAYEPVVTGPSDEAGRLARAHADQGQLERALEWCDRALEVNKLDAPLHYLRATILEEQGELEEAALALGRAIYLEPHFVMAHFALGALARRRGWQGEAARCFRNVEALLEGYEQDEILPEAGGMTAGRLREVVRFTDS